MKRSRGLMRLAALAAALSAAAAVAQATLPAPVLHYAGHEHYTTPAGAFVRYRFDVLNKTVFPAALFAPAHNLPPCGNNANSSRAWVDFFGQDGTRLYGFCALNSPDALGSLWFALPPGQDPPNWVYIEINDRQTGTRYRSNLERAH